MFKVFDGQISFGGMHDALEAVARHKNIKHGILRITSNGCSGLIGVFCGRFITGAVITLSGESGYPALRRLLEAKEGTFSLIDVSAEPLKEVNQSLGVDLQTLISSVDFSAAHVPLSEESLTVMSANHQEELRLIDTTFGEDDDSMDEMNSDERIEKINQTFAALESLPEQRNAPQAAMGQQQIEVSPVVASQSASYPEDDFSWTEQEYKRRPTNDDAPVAQADAAPQVMQMARHSSEFPQMRASDFNPNLAPKTSDQDNKVNKAEDFKRLRHWNAAGQMRMLMFAAIVVILMVAGFFFLGK